jgi:hypothetical protein
MIGVGLVPATPDHSALGLNPELIVGLAARRTR